MWVGTLRLLQYIVLVSADLSNWLILPLRIVSRGFESLAEMFSPKTLETLGALV